MSLELTVKRVSPKTPLKDDPDDFVGYEVFIDFMKQRALCKLKGDIVEIGAYMGRALPNWRSLPKDTVKRYTPSMFSIPVWTKL